MEKTKADYIKERDERISKDLCVCHIDNTGELWSTTTPAMTNDGGFKCVECFKGITPTEPESKKLSEWIHLEGEQSYCATRVFEGTDINDIANRVAFIEKSGRVRIRPFTERMDNMNWVSVARGTSEYGADLETREEVDAKLIELGYILPEKEIKKITSFNELPVSAWIESTDHFYLIRDSYPVTQGHTLIISRNPHKQDYFDLSDVEVADLDTAIWKARDLIIKDGMEPDGFNIGMNCGASAGQTIFQFHCHVIPRYKGDMDDPRGGVRHVIPEKGNYTK